MAWYQVIFLVWCAVCVVTWIFAAPRPFRPAAFAVVIGVAFAGNPHAARVLAVLYGGVATVNGIQEVVAESLRRKAKIGGSVLVSEDYEGGIAELEAAAFQAKQRRLFWTLLAIALGVVSVIHGQSRLAVAGAVLLVVGLAGRRTARLPVRSDPKQTDGMWLWDSVLLSYLLILVGLMLLAFGAANHVHYVW